MFSFLGGHLQQDFVMHVPASFSFRGIPSNLEENTLFAALAILPSWNGLGNEFSQPSKQTSAEKVINEILIALEAVKKQCFLMSTLGTKCHNNMDLLCKVTEDPHQSIL